MENDQQLFTIKTTIYSKTNVAKLQCMFSYLSHYDPKNKHCLEHDAESLHLKTSVTSA